MPPLMSADEVRSQLLQTSIQRIEEMRRPPRIVLYDKNWENPVPLLGIVRAEFEERLNETGEGSVTIQTTNKLYKLLVEDLGLWEDLHIVVNMSGKRWSGKATTITDDERAGMGHIELRFVHEYEHAKKIVCYSNPLLPPELQVPKFYAFAGPSVFGAKTLLFLNLLRRFAPLWALPEDLFNPGSWAANLNPANWPIVVMPGSLLFDTSMWSVISTRFGNAHDVLAPTLADAGLQLVARRWLPGDPQPAPDHFTLTQPTLVLDVIDKSGYRGLTGTMIDGLVHYVTAVADDLINEVATVIGVPDAPEYAVSGWMGTAPQRPWVAWRNARRTGGLSGIGEWQATVHKALAGAIVTGGHSPDWVNTGLKLLANALLGYIGAIFGNPGLTLGIFDTALEDILLAFHRVGNPIRFNQMGIRGPAFGEYWESTGGTGASLSALQAIRTGFDRTKAYRSYKVSVVNGSPYWVGRHFDVGDRVAAEVGRNGRWYVDHVYALKLTIDRESGARWTISIGDDRAQDQPGAMLARHVAQLKNLVQQIGVSS